VGVSPLAFDAMAEPESELLCTFVIGGLVAGATGTLSLPPAFVLRSVVPAPFARRGARLPRGVRRPHGHHGRGIYGAAMVAVGRNIHAALTDALTLRSENQALVFQREEHTRQLEGANRELDQRISERTAQLRAYGRRQRLAADLGCKALSKEDITAVSEQAAKTVREALHLDAVAVYELLPNEATLGLRGLDTPSHEGIAFLDVTNGLRPLSTRPIRSHRSACACSTAPRRSPLTSRRRRVYSPIRSVPRSVPGLSVRAALRGGGAVGDHFRGFELEARIRLERGELRGDHRQHHGGAIARRRNELVQPQPAARGHGRLATGVAHEINTPVHPSPTARRFSSDAHRHLRALPGARRGRRCTFPGARPGRQTAKLLEMRQSARIDYLLETAPQSISRIRLGLSRVTETVRATRGFGLGNTTPLAVDVNELLLSAAIITNHLTKRLADVKLDLADLPRIVVHPGELLQVLEGFITNASYAIEERYESGQRGNITMRSRVSGERVVIEVEDDGAGIPAARLPQIFEPFYTSKEAGRGSGQGLAIARDIIERGHGGRISVTSTVGTGTTFRVELPTAATHPTSWRSVVLSKKLTSLVPPPPAGRFARGA
jgi:signal transduction histidine kinase